MTPQHTEHVLTECSEANPLHHLWNNNGTWWLHCTVHRPDFTKQRIRRSLGTTDLAEAIRRRDARLRELARRADIRLSIRSGRLSPRRDAHKAPALAGAC